MIVGLRMRRPFRLPDLSRIPAAQVHDQIMIAKDFHLIQ